MPTNTMMTNEEILAYLKQQIRHYEEVLDGSFKYAPLEHFPYKAGDRFEYDLTDIPGNLYISFTLVGVDPLNGIIGWKAYIYTRLFDDDEIANEPLEDIRDIRKVMYPNVNIEVSIDE